MARKPISWALLLCLAAAGCNNNRPADGGAGMLCWQLDDYLDARIAELEAGRASGVSADALQLLAQRYRFCAYHFDVPAERAIELAEEFADKARDLGPLVRVLDTDERARVQALLELKELQELAAPLRGRRPR